MIPVGPYQLMPPLTDQEFELLKTDIAEHGVLVPIVLDDEGNILDGHNRLAAVSMLEAETAGLSIPYETTVVRLTTDQQKRDYVIALNLKRRHLSDEARLALLVALRLDGKSAREIGEIAGVSTATAWRKLQDAEAAGMFKQPEYTMGKDGKLRPTAYAPASYMSYKELVKEERSEQRAADRSTSTTQFPNKSPSFHIFEADITDPTTWESSVEPESLDAIITDPPYPQEYVHLFEDLGKFGQYALKPGAPLIAMTGHAYLPQYIELLSRRLVYHWLVADILGGANNAQHVWKAFVGWKPCLIFTNGKERLPYYFLDLVRSPGPDKNFHIWGQDVQTFQLFAYRFTQPGATICDPFVGGGTTAIAALSMHRKFIGFDNDPVAVQTTLERLHNTDWNNPLLTKPPLLEGETHVDPTAAEPESES
jgi:site-specific DNA-methyltransferase (adenine-specific)